MPKFPIFWKICENIFRYFLFFDKTVTTFFEIYFFWIIWQYNIWKILILKKLTVRFFLFSIFRIICQHNFQNCRFSAPFMSTFSEIFCSLINLSLHFLNMHFFWKIWRLFSEFIFFWKICWYLFCNFHFFKYLLANFLIFSFLKKTHCVFCNFLFNG